MFLKYKTIYNTVKKEGKKAASSSTLGLRRSNTNQSNKITCTGTCLLPMSYLFLYIVKGFTTPKKEKQPISQSAPFFPVTVP